MKPKQVWLVRYSHRHGDDVWPVFHATTEDEQIEELRQADTWEGDTRSDEYLEVYGPFPIPTEVVDSGGSTADPRSAELLGKVNRARLARGRPPLAPGQWSDEDLEEFLTHVPPTFRNRGGLKGRLMR